MYAYNSKKKLWPINIIRGIGYTGNMTLSLNIFRMLEDSSYYFLLKYVFTYSFISFI